MLCKSQIANETSVMMINCLNFIAYMGQFQIQMVYFGETKNMHVSWFVEARNISTILSTLSLVSEGFKIYFDVE